MGFNTPSIFIPGCRIQAARARNTLVSRRSLTAFLFSLPIVSFPPSFLESPVGVFSAARELGADASAVSAHWRPLRVCWCQPGLCRSSGLTSPGPRVAFAVTPGFPAHLTPPPAPFPAASLIRRFFAARAELGPLRPRPCSEPGSTSPCTHTCGPHAAQSWLLSLSHGAASCACPWCPQGSRALLPPSSWGSKAMAATGWGPRLWPPSCLAPGVAP